MLKTSAAKAFVIATAAALLGVVWVNLFARIGPLWMAGGIAVLLGSAAMLAAFLRLCALRSSWRVLLPAALVEAIAGFPLLVTSAIVLLIYVLAAAGIAS